MKHASLISPEDARTFSAFGQTAQFHLTGAETDGKYCMFTVTEQPGGGPPPHSHDVDDEWFYVLEGRVSFWKDGEWIEVGPGASAFIPHGVPHTYKNTGGTVLKMLVHTSPAGFENFFEAAHAEFARPEGPDMGRAMALAAQHGIRFV